MAGGGALTGWVVSVVPATTYITQYGDSSHRNNGNSRGEREKNIMRDTGMGEGRKRERENERQRERERVRGRTRNRERGRER